MVLRNSYRSLDFRQPNNRAEAAQNVISMTTIGRFFRTCRVDQGANAHKE